MLILRDRDYRGLKKRITVIRKAQPNQKFHILPSDDSPDEDASPLSSDLDEAMKKANAVPASPGKGQDVQAIATQSRTSEHSRTSLERDSISVKKASIDHPATTQNLKNADKGIAGHSTYSAPPPLHEVLAHLTPQEKAFFTLLDSQLDKVESFYMAREKEMLARGRILQQQLEELRDHRKLFQESTLRKSPSDAIPDGDGEIRSTSSALPEKPTAKAVGKRKDLEDDHTLDNLDELNTENEDRPRLPLSADPDSYYYAKRKLKKAVIEHYHGLELLHNYRVLNIDGFRKALKKFEKITGLKQINAETCTRSVHGREVVCISLFAIDFNTDQVEKSAFASNEAVRKMMSEMEVMYAAAFARGDPKRAKARLRAGNTRKSHHFSAFRSGLYVGLAIPALAYGLYNDFWMGDQFCSLVFTLSNLYFFVCVYVDGFSPNWSKCGAPSPAWPIGFSLAALPLLIRVVQSLKRYADSKLITHLINGGKYGSGIITYLFYFMWRHHQNERGTIFALWCLASTCYALYAAAWDLLMDWSLLKTRARYPLLRPDLIYSDQIPLYYFAIVRYIGSHIARSIFTHIQISDILIRFIWVIYIPRSGPNLMVRTFIGGFLEMLRRWQWNFYRLENEHLGNMDQYRVTREVPLPYALNDRNGDDDDGDDEDRQLKARR
ncbi:LOW QUALITY PROTEIN: hypothetical protein CVT26_012937 [Gymnopilus dilepis]|uniref:EXS domain-containing protein n=1 Tax=Gymnopilus dilepis TaxID=231916 RepID=A0A409Y4G8_9AGAR|nr:LOW QUALITY PROTEIN: hypothetical protein CVT26_012937 [Gymnopilus dilepis]